MFSRVVLVDLLQHMEWADARMWEAVGTEPPSDPKLRDTIVHLHVVQRAFLTAWRGGDVSAVFREGADFRTMSDVRAWARPYYSEVQEYVAGLSEDRLTQPFEMPWAAEIAQYLGRPPAPTALGETCFQVTSHSTHHRGQVNARLRELGRAPLIVDYIAWLWLGRPSAEWKA
jgi:uncharacterized damage-inducible protein DinB